MIGILGGMGPMATVDLFVKIIKNTPASCDQEHLRIIIDNNPGIPSRITAILDGTESPLPQLIGSAKLLEASGVEFILIPCNTAHYWLEDIQKAVNVDVINMIDNVAAYIQEFGQGLSGKIMLLATAATVKAGLYQRSFRARGIDLQVPVDADQEIISLAIEETKAGFTENNAYLSQLLDIMNHNAQNGIKAYIGGCTEIPLLFPYIESNFENYDPTELLARYAVQRALNS